METHIPEEIIIEILSLLPVKSLCMFKSVSKLWHSLISNPLFIQKHTQNHMSTYYGNNYLCDITRDDRKRAVQKTLIQRVKKKLKPCKTRLRYSNCLMIGGIYFEEESNKFISSLFKDYGNNDFLEPFKFKNETQVVNCPFLDFRDDIESRIIGSCNGLACIYNRKDEIALWNPTIGDLKVVPPSKLKRPKTDFNKCSEVGFGFDSCTNDYKIVQILFQKSECPLVPKRMEIYSLKTNSWRKYDHSTIPARFKDYTDLWGHAGGSMVHKNEIFCWSASLPRLFHHEEYKYDSVILWFDMRDEVFRTMPFPHYSLLKPFTRVKMCPLHDSISLLFYDSDATVAGDGRGVDKSIEIWSIKNLQEKESWTNLLSIRTPPKEIIRPLGFWNNGEFMILSKGKYAIMCMGEYELLLYNFRLGKFVTTGFEDHCRYRYLTSCVETLSMVISSV